MASVTDNWNGLGTQAKTGLAVGVALIVALALGLAVWAYRPDYQVLFADVAPADAAAMTAELERMKIPYQLGDGGNTILVPRELVYKTRLKVMGKDLPLHGAVGFEVFNNADFGMTEFVQKVNYQRAIQGELTRTILSIDGIASARVHLALPEQGLFKKTTAKPKASVTIVAKPGFVLAPDQVTGIQRLVAASVPDIVAADVTILDQHGLALTRVGGAEAGMENAAGALDSKRSADEYLTRKLSKLLDSTFGPGEAIATVDVTLNLDQNRVTTDEVMPARAGTTGSQAGVLVRSRQTLANRAGPLSSSVNPREGEGGGSSSTESDYQVGRRVGQLVVAPGATRRLTVAVVLKKALDEVEMERLRQVVSLTVGLNPDRGDAIVVYALERINGAPHLSADSITAGRAAASAMADAVAIPAPAAVRSNAAALPRFVLWCGAALVLLALLTWLALTRRPAAPRVAALNLDERERLLLQVRHWIDSGHERAGVAGYGEGA